MFCANCGAESSGRPHGGKPGEARPSRDNFECSGCGASMSYDATDRALKCPFCGSTALDARPDAPSLAPRWVIPFAQQRPQAEASLRAWLKRGFWRPSGLAREAIVVRMTPVYVPYWVFSAETHTYWTADTDQPPCSTRARWYPLAGEHAGAYSGLLVGASGALTPGETAAVCPFDLSAGVSPERVDLDRAIYERFSMPKKYARPWAQRGLESAEAEACCRECVPGNARNVHVNVRLTETAAEPVLLPVWIAAYRYRDRLYRFLINGQTGRTTGQAPFSWAKLAVAAAIVALALLMFLALARVSLGGPHSRGVPVRSRPTPAASECLAGGQADVANGLRRSPPVCATYSTPSRMLAPPSDLKFLSPFGETIPGDRAPRSLDRGIATVPGAVTIGGCVSPRADESERIAQDAPV